MRKGEIVGLAGVDGNGQTELVEILTGLRKAESGTITMLGKNVFNKTPKETFDNGISSIPADRQKHGLVLEFSNEDNLILQHFEEAPYSKHGILDRKAIKEHALDLIEKFDVRPRGCAEAPSGTLSGGNQQKVIIARWLANNPDVLIMDEPTRGIDVGAKYEIYQIMIELTRQGKSIIMISSEMPELIGMSHRILVMCAGKLTGEVSGEEATQENIMSMATQFN